MKRTQRIALILLLMIAGYSGYGQQDPLYTQYMHNPLSVNPGYAGSYDALNFTSLYREQWVGIDGAPNTLSLSVNSPIRHYNMGLGLNIIHDKIGPIKQTGFYGDYAYHVNVTERTKLGMGLTAGFNYYRLDLIGLNTPQPDAIDDIIDTYGEENLFLPNVGVGLYLYNDRYYLGAAVPKLLRNTFGSRDNQDDNTIVGKEERHLFVQGGLVLSLSEQIDFKPSITTRVVWGAPFSAELTAAFLLSKKIWLGGMYRFEDAFGGLVQFHLTPALKVGYAYDMTHSRLEAYSEGSHEIMLSYDIGFRKRKILSPRYF